MKYRVNVTFSYQACVEVEAESADQAEEMVRGMENMEILDPDWRFDGYMVECDERDFQLENVEAREGERIDLDQELVDDDTLEGGIAHAGETLREFLDEVGLSYNTPVEKINKALVECGIEPILAK